MHVVHLNATVVLCIVIVSCSELSSGLYCRVK
jgi:hypothetical protein